MLGLTVEEAARASGLAERTIKRRWQAARACSSILATIPASPEVECDALARIERLIDATTPRQRARIMAGASDAVRVRVAAEAKLDTGRDTMPRCPPVGSAPFG